MCETYTRVAALKALAGAADDVLTMSVATQTADHPDVVARISAHRLLMQARHGLGRGHGALMRSAAEHGWAEVELLTYLAGYAQQAVAGDLNSAAVDTARKRLRRLSDHIDDPVLAILMRAFEISIRPGGVTVSDEWDHGDQELAKMVAVLDDSDPSAPERGAAFVACGRAYGALGLQSVELEMYERAALSDAGLDARYRDLADINASEICGSRLTATLDLACRQFGLGRQAQARSLAEDAIDTLRADPSQLDAGRASLAAAELEVLGALAGRSENVNHAAPTGEPGGHPNAVGYHWVARAVRRTDAGDHAAAADAAHRALGELPATADGAVRELALGVVAHRPPVTNAAREYMARLAETRYEAHQRLVRAARQRIITERAHLEAVGMADRAYIDELTGLGNREALIRRLSKMGRRMSGHEELACLVVDIANFAAINHDHGDAVADDVLRQIAQFIRRQVRGDDLVARAREDAFVVLLEGASRAAGGAIADRIAALVAQHAWAGMADGLRVDLHTAVGAGRPGDVRAFIDHAIDGVPFARRATDAPGTDVSS